MRSVIDLSDASASLVPPLCPLWPTNCVHWAINVATILSPFGDNGYPWASMAMVLPPLLCTTCCATTAVLMAQATHKGRAVAVTQKQIYRGLGDHWASCPIFWSLKSGMEVAALCKGRSPACYEHTTLSNIYKNQFLLCAIWIEE